VGHGGAVEGIKLGATVMSGDSSSRKFGAGIKGCGARSESVGFCTGGCCSSAEIAGGGGGSGGE
jgi:hypothetical protein